MGISLGVSCLGVFGLLLPLKFVGVGWLPSPQHMSPPSSAGAQRVQSLPLRPEFYHRSPHPGVRSNLSGFLFAPRCSGLSGRGHTSGLPKSAEYNSRGFLSCRHTSSQRLGPFRLDFLPFSPYVMLDDEVLHRSWHLLQLKPEASPFPLRDIGCGSGGFSYIGESCGGFPLRGASGGNGNAPPTAPVPALSPVVLRVLPLRGSPTPGSGWGATRRGLGLLLSSRSSSHSGPVPRS